MNQPTDNQLTFNTCNSSLTDITCTTNDQHSISSCISTEMDMGWVHPWVGLGWVGLGWVKVF